MVVLWIVQIAAAGAFLMAGLMKLMRSKEQLAPQMGWVEDFSQGQVRLIGTAEVLAAAGLILPGVLGVLTWLTPLAAVGLTVLMLGAVATHARRSEPPPLVVTLVLGAIAAFVAVGRFINPI